MNPRAQVHAESAVVMARSTCGSLPQAASIVMHAALRRTYPGIHPVQSPVEMSTAKGASHVHNTEVGGVCVHVPPMYCTVPPPPATKCARAARATLREVKNGLITLPQPDVRSHHYTFNRTPPLPSAVDKRGTIWRAINDAWRHGHVGAKHGVFGCKGCRGKSTSRASSQGSGSTGSQATGSGNGSQGTGSGSTGSQATGSGSTGSQATGTDSGSCSQATDSGSCSQATGTDSGSCSQATDSGSQAACTSEAQNSTRAPYGPQRTRPTQVPNRPRGIPTLAANSLEDP